MSKTKKTCKLSKHYNIPQISLNNKSKLAKHKSMIKKTENNKNKISQCSVHVMPPQITDNDITALFNGIINVVRKKIELEAKAEILNANISLDKTIKALKEKEAECIRLKNEIIHLKAQLENK